MVLNKSLIPALRTGNSDADTDVLRVNLLSTQFSKSFNTTIPPVTKHDVISPVDDCPSDFLISESEVFTYLVNINCSKVLGPDAISGLMLRHAAIAITPLITTLFNMSISSGTFPECWKTSNVRVKHPTTQPTITLFPYFQLFPESLRGTSILFYLGLSQLAITNGASSLVVPQLGPFSLHYMTGKDI